MVYEALLVTVSFNRVYVPSLPSSSMIVWHHFILYVYTYLYKHTHTPFRFQMGLELKPQNQGNASSASANRRRQVPRKGSKTKNAAVQLGIATEYHSKLAPDVVRSSFILAEPKMQSLQKFVRIAGQEHWDFWAFLGIRIEWRMESSWDPQLLHAAAMRSKGAFVVGLVGP